MTLTSTHLVLTLRRPLMTVAFLCSLLGAPGASAADTIIQTRSFELSAQMGTTTVDPELFDLFAGSIGTLNSVDVLILGTMSLTAVLPPSFLETSGSLIPTPYSFNVAATLDFDGTSNFLNTPEVILNGTAPGGSVTQLLTMVMPFQFSFSYTAATDIPQMASVSTSYSAVSSPGSVAAIPPGLTFGERQDFVGPFAGMPLPVLPRLASETPILAGGNINGGLVGTWSADGQIRITYNYTPTPIPEPATMSLLGGGLIALAVRRRRARGLRPKG